MFLLVGARREYLKAAVGGASRAYRQGRLSGTDEDTERLIRWRGENEALFTGRRNAAVEGFETFIKDQALEGKVEAAFVKKKWENLKQKYKELKAPRTGVSTEGGEATAANWKWFGAMDEVLGDRPSITPPVLITSSVAPPAAVASPPSPPSPPSLASASGVSRGKRDIWVTFLRELDEREERAEERAERRERELQEREERVERERREEDRRGMERREREWREWMDARMREERREREERERESRMREEKLMALLEKFMEKK
ncbi:hypothetical protein ABVT39_008943 [Epinephelus coioides]